MAARSPRAVDVRKEERVFCCDVKCSDCVVRSGSDGLAGLFRIDVAPERPAGAGWERLTGKRRVAARSLRANKVRIEGRDEGMEEKEDLVMEEGIVVMEKLQIIGKL